MRHVEIILKVTERCNLNCRYCYFFNKENKDFEENPALISVSTVENLVRFLRTSNYQIAETVFQIDLHGGEPLLLGPGRFSELVSIIENGLHDAREVRFTVQTNATMQPPACPVFGRTFANM
ncbi:Anaerobic sulfatase-maturating enzyme [Pandoraea terrae]|uniref:Anaerobic sulfatase-maturating enzyme n=1 Tax=Pandoraea terrae TaxID=1537710 RepID=A0A5E4XDL9_9BURK|nr:radical SAM protein [Pandoraea terrae]VVE34228.1 Anaerobic sulfatase-maturating enzyme [Pandoraea terrae]